MRHFLANIITYAIATLLFLGAAAFAWMRSSQLLLADEPTFISRYAPAEDLEFHWHDLGRQSYARNCTNCHGSDGTGWDQYPPLTGIATLHALPGGPEYLIDLHLYGLASDRWGAPMPVMGHIHDVELAAVINHIIAGFGGAAGDFTPFQPRDIAARRGQQLSPRDVDEQRPGEAYDPRQ
ncbi:hypothetical protein BH23GEM9_BH23GEM9_23930 [soil metagenome]